MDTSMTSSRLIVAGLNGGTGKTILSLGLVRALHGRGLRVQPFKKGPDYIDAAWLGLAAERCTTNLDPFFLTPEQIRALFVETFVHADIAVIEGNRGLYDGRDVTGTCSTAELARILDTPVVLAMDCTKMTRTAAAILSGVASFEKDVRIAGVVLNRVAGERHRSILQQCIEEYTDVPVLGALPRLKKNPIPERHMGLVSDREFDGCRQGLDAVEALINEHIDVERVISLACDTKPLQSIESFWQEPVELGDTAPRIGYIRDAALWFYYEENFEALRRAGAHLVELSLLDDAAWPELDALYLGGGFPETLAQELSANTERLAFIRHASRHGMPIYAECGGFMVLSDAIEMNGVHYPMSGVFPVRAVFHSRPQGLGYVDAVVTEENPFFACGSTVRGHEFHYSQCVANHDATVTYALTLAPGTGMGKGYDGLVQNNTFAAYTHIFAPAVPEWAPAFVQAAIVYARSKTESPA